jgi:hypothetical protein
VFTKERHGRREWVAYLAVSRQIDLEGLGVVLEAERRHGEEDVLAVDRLALLLLALLGGCLKSVTVT